MKYIFTTLIVFGLIACGSSEDTKKPIKDANDIQRGTVDPSSTNSGTQLLAISPYLKKAVVKVDTNGTTKLDAIVSSGASTQEISETFKTLEGLTMALPVGSKIIKMHFSLGEENSFGQHLVAILELYSDGLPEAQAIAVYHIGNEGAVDVETRYISHSPSEFVSFKEAMDLLAEPQYFDP